MSNHVQSFSRRLDPLLSFLEASESCGCLCIGFLWIKMLKRDKKGIKRSSEFFLKVLMGVSPFTDVYGSLRAFECLWCFASFPRTLEKGPREGQLIPQEIGTVWASLGLGEAWWNGETIVWGLWPRWIGTVLPVWDLLLFFQIWCCSALILFPIPLYPVHSRSIIFPSFSILFPSFSILSILVHPCPILSPSYPFLSHPQYSVGLQDLPRERLQDRLENDGSQVDLLVFSKTPGGHRVDTMPYEWTLPHANPYEWNPSTVLKWPHSSPCRFIL